jgi:hypothetical protein
LDDAVGNRGGFFHRVERLVPLFPSRPKQHYCEVETVKRAADDVMTFPSKVTPPERIERSTSFRYKLACCEMSLYMRTAFGISEVFLGASFVQSSSSDKADFTFLWKSDYNQCSNKLSSSYTRDAI